MVCCHWKKNDISWITFYRKCEGTCQDHWRKMYSIEFPDVIEKFALYYTIMMQQTSLFYQCTIHHGFTHYAVPLCKLTITAVDISEKERSGQFAPKYVLLTASLEGFVFSIQQFVVCSKHLAYFYSPKSKLLATTMSNTLIAHSLHMSPEGPLGLCVQYPPNHLDLRSA